MIGKACKKRKGNLRADPTLSGRPLLPRWVGVANTWSKQVWDERAKGHRESNVILIFQFKCRHPPPFSYLQLFVTLTLSMCEWETLPHCMFVSFYPTVSLKNAAETGTVVCCYVLVSSFCVCLVCVDRLFLFSFTFFGHDHFFYTFYLEVYIVSICKVMNTRYNTLLPHQLVDSFTT